MSEQQETALVPAQIQIPNAIEQALKQPPQAAKITRLAAFTATNLTEAIALAKLMARSELVPKEYRNKPENVLIGMQYAAELGIPPLTGLQNISIINGRAAVWGDLFLALIQSSPNYEWHKEYFEGQGDQYGAVCVMKRKGQEPHTVKFTVALAKTAKLWGKRSYEGKDTPWITSPDRMLQMRARGFCGRDKFADALKGLIIAEEAMDLPVDTSEAKRARESATLDVTASVASLAPSPEPNRGHADTGLEKKEAPTMCGSCGKIGAHAEDCKYAEQEKKTSKPTEKRAFMIFDVLEKTKKDGTPYLLLQVIDNNDKSGKLHVWHRGWDEQLKAAKGQSLLAEVSESKQGNQMYHSLDHILELAGVPYVNDKPAQQAEMPQEEAADF